MSLQPDIAAARDDVQRARDQISDTIAELEQRVTAPVQAVKQRLDVGRVVREHPWAALAVAVGAGVVVASTGADVRAAELAAEQARQAARKARDAGAAGLRVASEAPSRSRQALGGVVDALGAKLAISIVDALREPTAEAPR